MEFENNEYIKSDGSVFYPALLEDISKSRKALQPIFEAFTNSLESLQLVGRNSDSNYIRINLYKTNTELENFEPKYELDNITIEDNGIGFNSENFNRFCCYKDNRKGFNNRGSGRIQYLHFFENSFFESVYIEDEQTMKRKFILSKSDQFLKKNSIIFHTKNNIVDENKLKTTVKFENILSSKDKLYYNDLTSEKLNNELLDRYLSYFCTHRNNIPVIEINDFLDGEIHDTHIIDENSIPELDKKDSFKIPYLAYNESQDKLIELVETEEFKLKTYKIEKNKLDKNQAFATSKGEIAKKLRLDIFSEDDHIDGYKYLFLLSSPYIDNLDGNTRGEFSFKTRKNLEDSVQSDLFDPSTKNIIIEDINEKVSNSIIKNYPEIAKKQKDHNEELSKLKEMFLLDEKTLKEINPSINDSHKKILKKVYQYDIKKVAEQDAKIKSKFDEINLLDPKKKDYQEKLNEQVTELVKDIPIQNRTILAHYVARRKLVLELFERMLTKEIEALKNKKSEINEQLLHNILFTQHTNNSSKSDLWLINEDFIYFSGTSDIPLNKIQINGVELLDPEFIEAEQNYLTSLGEDRTRKKPDVLLFPEEGKCVILEFKRPSVNVTNYLTQINKYASLIYNYSKREFNINTFYGYLIGEAIEANEVRGADGSFVNTYHFNYLVRPHENIVCLKDERPDGSLYTEVIKYSTLLERAKRRNKIFIDKLLNSNNDVR